MKCCQLAIEADDFMTGEIEHQDRAVEVRVVGERRRRGGAAVVVQLVLAMKRQRRARD